MTRRETARARATLQATVRRFFGALGYEEVETPCLVPAPGMEPHIDAFCAPFVPEGGGAPVPLWLQSSPEYAMKRLLAEGFERIFQLARVFRNGELSATHNPEFTMLELYEVGSDASGIMARLEALLAEAAIAVAGRTRLSSPRARARSGEEQLSGPWAIGSPAPRSSSEVEAGPGSVRGVSEALELGGPFERLTVAEAFARLGVDVLACDGDAPALRAQLVARGLDGGRPGDSFEDLFFRTFLDHIEPALGVERPTWVVEWPASMAALARLKPDDPRVAERFELYAGGLELANGWSELTDAAEQRRRFEAERALRVKLGRPVYPIDEKLLAALPRMPPCGGVAVGLDRLLMLLTGAGSMAEALLFPAESELACGRALDGGLAHHGNGS